MKVVYIVEENRYFYGANWPVQNRICAVFENWESANNFANECKKSVEERNKIAKKLFNDDNKYIEFILNDGEYSYNVREFEVK